MQGVPEPFFLEDGRKLDDPSAVAWLRTHRPVLLREDRLPLTFEPAAI